MEIFKGDFDKKQSSPVPKHHSIKTYRDMEVRYTYSRFLV
jgi:hypothetical protein